MANKTCPKCGGINAGNILYCSACGTSLSEVSLVKDGTINKDMYIKNEPKDNSFIIGELKRDLRQWGLALIAIGIIAYLFSDTFSPVWGISLIIIGIINLIIMSKYTFIFTAISLFIVSIVNIIIIANSPTSEIIMYGCGIQLLQISWAAREMVKYYQYRSL